MEVLNNPYVTLHNIYYGVLHNISSVALPNKSYVTKKITEFSENLKNFNSSLYSDNGGLIYGNGSGGTRGGGQGNHTSTHQHLHVYPHTPISPHIPPNIPIFLQIFSFHSINSPTCVLPSYISIYLVISTLQIKYYVLSE